MGSPRKFSIESYRASSRRHYVFRIALHKWALFRLGSVSNNSGSDFALRYDGHWTPLHWTCVSLDNDYMREAKIARDSFCRSARGERCSSLSRSLPLSIHLSVTVPPRPRGERAETVHGFYEGPESSIGGQLSAKQTGPRGKV